MECQCHWSFAEKTFVKQSMMLCAFEILLKNGRKTGGNRSSMNLSSVVGHAWAVTHELSSATGHAWVVTRERPCRYKSTNLVQKFIFPDRRFATDRIKSINVNFRNSRNTDNCLQTVFHMDTAHYQPSQATSLI